MVLGSIIRKVNRKFKWAAEDLLNGYFKSLFKRIQALIVKTQEAIKKTKDDFEVKCLCRLMNLLEILLFEVKYS